VDGLLCALIIIKTIGGCVGPWADLHTVEAKKKIPETAGIEPYRPVVSRHNIISCWSLHLYCKNTVTDISLSETAFIFEQLMNKCVPQDRVTCENGQCREQWTCPCINVSQISIKQMLYTVKNNNSRSNINNEEGETTLVRNLVNKGIA